MSTLQNLCFKLFQHVQYVSRQNVLSPLLIIACRSTVYRTRFQAIKRWGDILQDHHEIYVWLFCTRKQETVALANDLIRNVEAFREALENTEDVYILDKTALLIDCHSVGLEFISLSRGRLLMDSRVVEVEWQGPQQFSVEEIEKWEMFFHYLLDSIVYVTSSDLSPPLTANFDILFIIPRTKSISGVPQWYIQLWLTQIDSGRLNVQIALKLCHHLRRASQTEWFSFAIGLDTVRYLYERIYVYLARLLDFGSPLKIAGWCECEFYDGVIIHLPSAVATFNDLVQSYHVCTIVCCYVESHTKHMSSLLFLSLLRYPSQVA